jgi:hypothetical protein
MDSRDATDLGGREDAVDAGITPIALRLLEEWADEHA